MNSVMIGLQVKLWEQRSSSRWILPDQYVHAFIGRLPNTLMNASVWCNESVYHWAAWCLHFWETMMMWKRLSQCIHHLSLEFCKQQWTNKEEAGKIMTAAAALERCSPVIMPNVGLRQLLLRVVGLESWTRIGLESSFLRTWTWTSKVRT